LQKSHIKGALAPRFSFRRPQDRPPVIFRCPLLRGHPATPRLEERYAFILTTAQPRALFPPFSRELLPYLSHPDSAESASSHCPGGTRHSYGSPLYLDCLCKAPNAAPHPLARHVGIVLQRLCHVADSVTTAANNPPSCLTG
jgi:hypothetical protein